MGKSFVVSNLTETTVFASYLIRIRTIFVEQYISYVLDSSLYWNFIAKNKSGTGQPNVNAKNYQKL